MNIGYIGCGAHGLESARRLLPGHRLQVWRGTAGTSHALEKDGAAGSGDLAAVLRESDVVMLCAGSSAEARELLFGEGKLASALPAGMVLIDQSRSDPAETRAIAAQLSEAGVTLVDIALHSEASSFDDGASALFAGGPSAAVESVRGLLDAMCPVILHCGEAGNGHAMKVITSAIAACNRLITYESAAMGIKNGLAVQHIATVINTSSGASSASERVLPALAAHGRTADLTLGEAVQDLNLCSNLAMTHGVPMLIGNLVRGTFETACNELGGAASLDDLAQLYEQGAGFQFTETRQ